MKQSIGDTIKVYVRVRPLNQKQKQRSTQTCVNVENSTSIQMKDKQPDHRFSFDHIFQGQSTQVQVYEKVGFQVVESAFEGFNGTVFAYGQTSSGKTHTCIGPDYMDQQKRGILPRMIGHIYDKIKKEPSYIQFRIKISMVEIYMQKIKDLLDPSKSDLKIRQKAGKGIYIQDVTQQYVASQEETIGFIKKGIANRSVGQTNMNDTSSRSHMAFIITLYQNNLKDASAKSGRIILVDLAGSQKISKTGAQGKLLDQAKQINKSLLSLGNVINALTQNKVAHIPYRDSKLTRLLQESLGGNSKTNLIINVSPSELNQSQTLSSLRFGNRAKQIKNKPKVNRQYTVAQLLLLLQKSEKRIQQLQQIISQLSLKKIKTTKKTSQVYVQNLLDSDHPILQTDQQQPPQLLTKPSSQKKPNPKLDHSLQKKTSKLRHAFQSEYLQSQSENERLRSEELAGKGKSHKDRKVQELGELGGLSGLQELNENQSKVGLDQEYTRRVLEEKEILAEEIQLLNIEKVQLCRELDIIQQKYDCTLKQNKSNQSKITTTQKQNQKLLQKLVSQTYLLQQNQLKLQQLQQKLTNYQQKILNIAALQQKQNPMTKVFGAGPSQLAQETKKIAQMVRSNMSKENQLGLLDLEDRIQRQMEANQGKDGYIRELQQRNKVLEEEIGLFRHLENVKQAFIQQKLKFSAQKQRTYKDLQNRILKVLQLEQKLDEQRQKRKYFQQLIKSQQSQKTRKIVLLQQHLNQISQNFYVLKGQQSSWNKDAKRVESKLEQKNKRILALEKQIVSLKEQVQVLKLKIEDLEINPREDSILDLDFSIRDYEDDQERRLERNTNDQASKPKIVKVIKSSNFTPPAILL